MVINIDKGTVPRLVQECLAGEEMVAYLAIKEKKNIELMILNFLKHTFYADAEVSRQDQEGRQVDKYLTLLTGIRAKIIGNLAVPRSDLQQLADL